MLTTFEEIVALFRSSYLLTTKMCDMDFETQKVCLLRVSGCDPFGVRALTPASTSFSTLY